MYPAVGIARRLVTSGGLGRVSHIDASDGIRCTWATASDFPVTNRYGGVIYDFGTHLVDEVL
jgi:predicted dehydrogenase